MNSEQFTYVKDLKPGLKNLNVMFIVLEIGEFRSDMQQFAVFFRCIPMIYSASAMCLLHCNYTNLLRVQGMRLEQRMVTILDHAVLLIRRAR